MIDLREVRSVTEFQRNIKVAAIHLGIQQIERGEGIPLAEAAAKLRKKHGFSR